MILDLALIWVWIAICAALAVSGVVLAYRRLTPAGVLSCTGGLGLVAAAVYQLHPSLERYRLPADVQELHGVNEILRSKLRSLQAEVSDFKIRYEDIRYHIMQAKAMSNNSTYDGPKHSPGKEMLDSHSLLARNVIDLGQTLHKASQLTKTLTNKIDSKIKAHAVTTQQLRRAKRALARSKSNLRMSVRLLVNTSRLVSVLEQDKQHIRSIYQTRVMTIGRRSQLTPPCNFEQHAAIKAIAEILEGSISNTFAVTKIATSNLIADRPGVYYKIEAASIGSRIIFAAGQFRQVRDPLAFRDILNRLYTFILLPIEEASGATDAIVYVRGGADRGGELGPLAVGDEKYRHVAYFPLMAEGAGAYKSDVATQVVGAKLHNDHLPVLRAEFVREALGHIAPSTSVAVLQGSSIGSTEGDRSVDFIVYLKLRCRPPQ